MFYSVQWYILFASFGRYIATLPSYSANLIQPIGLNLSGSLFSHMLSARHVSRNTLRFHRLADSLSSQDLYQLPN